jgi:GAF domain-containing protein
MANDETGIRELTDLLLATPSFEDYAQHIVTFAAAKIVPGTSSCGLTMLIDGRPRTVASSSDLASRVDEIQYGHAQGPCLEALAETVVIVVNDLEQDHRWEGYRQHALAQGVRSSLSVPIRSRDEPARGALNLYFSQVTAFDDSHVHEGTHFADQASGALELATRLAKHTTTTAQLQEAMTSRSVIDHAIGIVMAQNRCTPEEAFDVLRRASQNRNVKLRVIATDIVRTVSAA